MKALTGLLLIISIAISSCCEDPGDTVKGSDAAPVVTKDIAGDSFKPSDTKVK